MPVTIKVNGPCLSVVHKFSNGFSSATIPDVCKTPTPGGPVPIPYPNIAQSVTNSDGTTTVKTDKAMTNNKGSKFAISNGDNAGTLGGVKSNVFMKEATWINYSFDVKMDNKNVCRLTDPMFHNAENAANMQGETQSPQSDDVVVIKLDCDGYPDDEAPRWKQEKNPERWKVRPTKGGRSTRLPEHSDTDALRDAFQRRVDQGLSRYEKGLLRDLLQGPSSLIPKLPSTGAAVVSMISSLSGSGGIYSAGSLGGNFTSYMPNYHHLRPTWAGGGNSPSNIWPVTPGHQTVGVHRWWDNKIKSAVEGDPELKKLLTGKKPPPSVKTISENNMGKMAEKCRNMKPPKTLVVEMDCPGAVS